MKKLKGIVLLCFLLPFCLVGQNTIIKGFIFNDETGESVPFANVSLEGTTYGVSTDINGFFILNKIPPGKYILQATSVGYETYSEEIQINKGEVLNKKITIKSSSFTLGGVDIKANRVDRTTETNVSVEKISLKQVKQIPSIGGQADLAQYLQVLPGVTFTGDQGGQLYIRGGSMIQNKVLLDNMVVYNPFHSIGLFSVFESDAISNVDVYSGGFGAEFGGRISSIMNVNTRDGNRRRHSGKVGASTFGMNFLMEGPLKKSTPTSGSSISYLFSAKNSYLSKTSPVLYSYTDKLPYDFFDMYGKISLIGQDGSKLNVFGFNFSDNVNNYLAIADYKWRNFGMGMNFLAIPGESALLEGVVAFSDYKVEMQNNLLNKPSESHINNFTVGLYMTYFLGKNKLKYGLDIEGGKTYYSIYNDHGIRFPSTPTPENSTEVSAFMSYEMIFDKLLITPGIRAMYYASLSEFSPEPRLAIKYNAFENVRFKFASGIYSQSLMDVKSDRDVVNLFVGFLSGTGDHSMVNTYRGKDITSRLQKAYHLIFGMEIDVTEHLLINIEPYFKRFSQLINVNRNKIYEVKAEYKPNGSNPKPDFLMADYIVEKGNAYGLDVNAKYEWDKMYIWLAYSLGFVDRTDELQTYNPHYDRRHNLNVLVAYTLGNSREWELSFRWNYGSGFPFTTTSGAYEKIDFQNIDSDYLIENGELGLLYTSDYLVTDNGVILYSRINKGRLPAYHRLDFMVKRKFSLGRNSILETNVSITNLYNRENMFYFNRVTFERINQLPIMPSVGLILYF